MTTTRVGECRMSVGTAPQPTPGVKADGVKALVYDVFGT
jgi:hypothetical protein